MNVPSQQNFATEVRSSRLTTLWQYTMAGAVVVFWLVATLGTLQRTNIAAWLLSMIAVMSGCLVARLLLQRNRFAWAVWAYTLGIMGGAGLLLISETSVATQVIPFVFPLLVFMVGLLVSPGQTLAVTIMSAIIVILSPTVNPDGGGLGWPQLFAIGLTFVALALAAQVTGELYQITEWALFNYQRERRTTEALFENRQALERSLLRSQALSEELQETNAELESARFAAEEAKHFRGQFLANMSHELRTPLNAIIGFSETMLRFPAMYDDVTLPKAYEGDLSQIYNSGRQLLNLINDILDLSKVDAGKLELHMQRVETGPIIEMTLSTAAGLVGNKPIRLERDLPDVLPVVWADEGRLRQVLMNLYSNAVKFTDQGSITLTVRETEAGAQFTLKDTGVGIDPRFHEAIFEEFKQAGNNTGRDPRAGSGLGLTISRQLLTLMGGRVWVESEVGKGSSFHVIIPLYRTQDIGSQPKRPADFPVVIASRETLATPEIPLAEKVV